MAVRNSTAPAADRPWRRPGAYRYGLARLHGLLTARVDVYESAPGAVIVDRDVAVTMRDGTILRVNVHRPRGDGPFPVLLSAHPYGKDNLPTKTRFGRYRTPAQYRMLRQTSGVRFSSLTGWEAPDPVWWAERGYALVNCDLRGSGTSDGVGSLLSDQEGEDVYDLIEWAGAQRWSTGAVATIGVSYLAISQWKAAALRPPSLKAIVPWEGFTNAYRDFFRTGGIAERGFGRLWAHAMKRARLTFDIDTENQAHPTYDEFWQSLVPEVEKIEVPALICGSFSDNNLHSRGSISGFERIGSTTKHLYTHRSGKWSTFYSAEALVAQQNFLGRHLRGVDAPKLERVRVEVRESRDRVVRVRAESAWPPSSVAWRPLFLGQTGLADDLQEEGSISFGIRSGGVRFGWIVPEDIEVIGPMALRLHVEVAGTDDVGLFVGVEKWRDGKYVPFEGSFGFGRDRVATGWQRAALRELDPGLSRPFEPVHTFREPEPLAEGEIVAVDIALGPSATLFRRGEELRLVVAGRWLWPRNPLTGQFPSRYVSGRRGKCTLHWGPTHDSHLLIPAISS